MSEKVIDFASMPHSYEVCWNRSCPLAETCLRQLAAEHLDEKTRYARSVNLNAVHPETGSCSEHRPVRTVRNAYGLRHIYDNVPSSVKDGLYRNIRYKLGNTMYYHYYNERKPITPRVQAIIETEFREAGISKPVVYGRYVETPEW